MPALAYIDRPTARFLDSPRLLHGMPQYTGLFQSLIIQRIKSNHFGNAEKLWTIEDLKDANLLTKYID
jgi:hypothetical protein